MASFQYKKTGKGEERMAEKLLMHSDEKFEDFCNNASDLMQSVTPEGGFRWVNNAWLETLGYNIKEIADMTVFDVTHPGELEHCQGLFMRVMAGEDIGLIETIFISKDGRKIFVEGNVNCEIIDGKPVYTRAIFRDITIRKKVEEERERLIKELQETLDKVKMLSGLLPICAWCKKIRDDKGYWANVEQYIIEHSLAEFTHGICPECEKKRFPGNDKKVE